MITHEHHPEQVIVGIDGSVASRAALRWALDHAHPGDTIHLLHAAPSTPSTHAGIASCDDDDGSDRGAQALLRRELARAQLLPHGDDVSITGEVLRGDPKTCLLDAEIGADAIVVGSGGHGIVARAVIGSVCSHLAKHAGIPVIVIPDPRHRGKHRDLDKH
jgi:nucleotide-binding universal stress UspA family protein